MSKEQEYDLFNNPMVTMAKNAMTEEQMEDYKKMGEYMYSSVDYKIKEVGSKVTAPTNKNLAKYASEGIKAGLDPMELSDTELRALEEVYGSEWYKKFGYTEEQVPKPFVQLSREQP